MHDTKSEFVHGTGLKYDDLFNPSSYFSEGYFDCDKLDDVESLSSGPYWTHEKRPHDDPGVLARAILRIIRHGASNRTIGKAVADASVPEIADLDRAIYDFLSRVHAESTDEDDEEQAADPIILTAGVDAMNDHRDICIIAWDDVGTPNVLHNFSVPGSPGGEWSDAEVDRILADSYCFDGKQYSVSATAHLAAGHYTSSTVAYVARRNIEHRDASDWAIRITAKKSTDSLWPKYPKRNKKGQRWYPLDIEKLLSTCRSRFARPIGQYEDSLMSAVAAKCGFEAQRQKDRKPNIIDPFFGDLK